MVRLGYVKVRFAPQGLDKAPQGEPNCEADIIIHYKDIMKTVISRIFKDKCVYFYQINIIVMMRARH